MIQLVLVSFPFFPLCALRPPVALTACNIISATVPQGTDAFVEVMVISGFLIIINKADPTPILYDPAWSRISLLHQNRAQNHMISSHLRSYPFNDNRCQSIQKVSQNWSNIAYFRNMRNLILKQYLPYGKHIGLTTGGPRHHTRNITTTKTTNSQQLFATNDR